MLLKPAKKKAKLYEIFFFINFNRIIKIKTFEMKLFYQQSSPIKIDFFA